MLQAMTTPVFRSVVVGGLVFGLLPLAAFVRTPHQQSGPVTHRLALHTVSSPTAIYLSAWNEGDVEFTFATNELTPITFKNRGAAFNCRGLATETLVPIDDRTFSYEYTEEVLDCDPGASVIKTPRSGIVTVED